MLLKRSIVLAAAVLLFIVSFVLYFEFTNARMEETFKQDRENHHLDGVVLTSSGPATPAPATAPATHDTNTLIGPVPPSAPDSTPTPAAPDSSPAPAPAPAPDSNAAPVAPAPSTMNSRNFSSVFQTAAFHGETLPLVTIIGQTSPHPDSTPSKVTPTASPAPVSTTSAPVHVAPVSKSAGASEGSVIVLLYHQFVPAGVHIPAKLQWTMNVDVFESEMKYIHDNNYHVVPLSDVIRFIKHEITLPPGSVCITIDDGYKSAIVHAAPILKKYGYPWTYFVYPAFITVNEGSGAASWKDLLELQAEGVDIESHSMTHPTLTKHGSKSPEQYAEWLKNETAGSKALLEQKMGKTINCFAYPFGAYNKQVEQAVVDAGYEAILTVADNPVHSTTNLHSIGRYTITQNVEKNFAAYLRQGALGLSNVDPAPGGTISEPRPVITATLGYPGILDPQSIETSVRDFGVVRHDFDPETNTVRLYLPRDLVASTVLVNIRVKDGNNGQVMVANWHFNYEPSGAAISHSPIAKPATTSTAAPSTNAPTAAEPEPMDKSAAGTPLDAQTQAPAPAPKND